MSIFPYAPDSPQGLAARWVQWAAATGPFRNPILDRTGRHAHHRQPNDVWFLAGCFGGNVERRCTVPVGRPLFFPAFNMWCPHGTYIPPLPAATGEAHVDQVPHPVTTIDVTELFDVRGAFLNPVTRRRRRVPMRVWGIWARVDPLAPGPHTVAFAGTDGHGFHVAATYQLQVA
ncbi:hypothetical protein ACLQ3D_11400 [Micromonospora vinacea]|uniref:Uncharacterized protein n=1 Tax=Micromonospora vinacea TaxID=709878 RepID=A0ABS0KAX3_9ACTN|nr:hypothetical protein [Micromonospora vinacea]MBG6105785.1 hypothetical protein [Micromonospora vinacea]WSZ78053.1 hypothetical protein OH804_06090 [Micromonospora sp. NBC_00860]WTA65512.1 hypothetical protein OHB51_23740 [Micromonospora sp. NBC_00855]